MRFSPHFQLFYFNDRLEFCEFFEWKIKRINNADLFSPLPLLIFIKGANISIGHCISVVVLSLKVYFKRCHLRSAVCVIDMILKCSKSVIYEVLHLLFCYMHAEQHKASSETERVNA